MYRLFQSVSHSRYKRTKFTQEDLKLIFSSKKISFKSPWVNFVFIYTYHAPPPSFPQKKSLYLYLPCPTAHLFILTKSHRLIFPFDVARRARVFNRKTRPKNFRGASRRVACVFSIAERVKKKMTAEQWLEPTTSILTISDRLISNLQETRKMGPKWAFQNLLWDTLWNRRYNMVSIKLLVPRKDLSTKTQL